MSPATATAPRHSTGAERPNTETPLELRIAAPARIGAQVYRREIRAGGDREQSDEYRGRVEPAREQVAGGIPHRHAAGSDPTHRGAERERSEQRRDSEQRVDRALLAARGRARAEGVGGPPEDDPHRGDEE